MTPRDGSLASSKRPAGIIAVAIAGVLACTPAAVAQVPGPSPLVARGSVEQVLVTEANPGERLRLLRHGTVVDTRPAGELGGAVFRGLQPGGG